MKTRFLFSWVFSFVLAGSVFLPCVVFAQHYPDHPVQLVIPNVAGSSMDNSARILADELERELGARVVPLNKPGAATVLGTDFVVRSKKDGYTILYAGASSLVMAPATSPEVVPFDPARDLEPLGFHYFLPNTVNTRTGMPWKNFVEFIDYARKNPEKLRVATSGVGHPTHIMLEMIQAMTGARFTHVPLKGGAPVVTSVLGGHVEVCCDTPSNIKPHMDAGKMQILLTTYKMPFFPDVPTITELGYKESLPVGWMGLWAPSGIPEDVRKVLVAATEKAVKNSKDRTEQQLMAVCEYKTPVEQTKLREEQYKQIYEIAGRMGLRKQ